MLATYCTNTECSEVNLAKEVPAELAGEEIVCGACGEPTTAPAEVAADPGEAVR